KALQSGKKVKCLAYSLEAVSMEILTRNDKLREVLWDCFLRIRIRDAIPIGFFCAEKERAVQSFKLAFEIDQDNAAGLTLQIKAGDWDSIAVILYVYGYNYLRSQCAYDSLPKRIILESRLFSGDNKFMFTYTTQFQILFKASFLFSNLENHIF
ncbi:hypothetical protein ACJX0J_016349, partial [Zea mays]